MRRILGLLLLSQVVVGFLPRCPVPAASPNARLASVVSTATRLEPLSALGGGGGEFDLLKGSGSVSKVSKDPAPGEFDLLGGKAQEDAAVIKEVRCVRIRSMRCGEEHQSACQWAPGRGEQDHAECIHNDGANA